MRSEEILEEIKRRLDGMTIHEVRQTARGVHAHITSGQKGAIIASVLDIATGRAEPAPVSKRGAPPKSDKYDENLVDDILSCREYFLATSSEPKPSETAVNDPSFEFSAKSEREYCGFLDKDGANYVVRAGEPLFIPEVFVSRYCLRIGDKLSCLGRKKSERDFAGVYEVLSVNGVSAEECAGGGKKRNDFSHLTHVNPSVRIKLTSGRESTLRMIDLFAPLALGQRAVVSAPSGCGKTTVLKAIARGICSKYRDFEIIILTLGARPEEITDFKKSGGEYTVFHTSFDRTDEEHYGVCNLAFEYAKRLAELGKNAIILADGLSENLPPDAVVKFLYCAISAEEGGSLTVVAATPENYAAISNMTLTLSPRLAAERVFPAIDILKSFSRGEEYLLSGVEKKLAAAIRYKLAHGGAEEDIIELFGQTENNEILAEMLENGR